MSYHRFRSKVENAFKAVIQAGIPDTLPALNYYLSNNSLDPANAATTFQLPCVVIECSPGPEHPLGAGNYHFDCKVEVRTQSRQADGGADPVTLHDANVAAVFDALKVSDLAAQLSAAVDDFYVFDPVSDLGPSLATAQGIFGDAQTFRGYGCPIDITA